MQSSLSNLMKKDYTIIINKINSDMRNYGLIEKLNDHDIYTLISYFIKRCRRGIFKNNKWLFKKRVWSDLKIMKDTCRKPCIEHYLTFPGTPSWINKLLSSILDEKMVLNMNTICAALTIDGFISSRIVRRIIRDIRSEYEKSTISFINTPLFAHIKKLKELNELFYKNFPIMYKTRSYHITKGFLSEFYNELASTPLNIISLMELGKTHSYGELDKINSGYEYALKMFRELRIDTLIKYTMQYFSLEPDIVGGYSEYIDIVNSGAASVCSNIVQIYMIILSSFSL